MRSNEKINIKAIGGLEEKFYEIPMRYVHVYSDGEGERATKMWRGRYGVWGLGEPSGFRFRGAKNGKLLFDLGPNLPRPFSISSQLLLDRPDLSGQCQ
jgi:hypothetical protein